MKFLFAVFFSLLLLTAGAHAQWVSKTYALDNGWNGLWLPGDASYTTVADLFSTYPTVTEVWRWNPNPDQTQFTQTPSAPTVSSDEWTVWKRNDASEQKLSRMVGNSSYLVRCSASTSISLKLLAQPPAATWLVSGANFLGFPSLAGTSAPSMSAYFASFPSANTTVLAPSAKIYKYIGGELGASNPMQVSPSLERLDANKAYWFNVATVSDFTAPVEYEVPSASGLAFGRTLTAMTVGVKNRSTTSLTLTVTLDASEPAPTGQLGVSGGVPLTRRIFNSTTNAYDETPVGGSFTVTIPASGRINLDFGIGRGLLSGNSSAYYASILHIKDSGNLSEVRLPVSAQTATTAGLWICQARVTNVKSTLPNTGSTTSQPFPLLFLTHMDSAGIPRLLTQAFVGRLTAAGNPLGIAVSESKVLGYSSSDVKPIRYFSCQMPLNRVIPGTGSFAVGATTSWQVSIPFNDPSNPFVHAYHPDHDNLDATFSTTLTDKQESYSITRTCTFTFTAAPPDGSTVPGWGTTVLGGTYFEQISGLHKSTLQVAGAFAMRRISELSEIDLTLP